MFFSFYGETKDTEKYGSSSKNHFLECRTFFFLFNTILFFFVCISLPFRIDIVKIDLFCFSSWCKISRHRRNDGTSPTTFEKTLYSNDFTKTITASTLATTVRDIAIADSLFTTPQQNPHENKSTTHLTVPPCSEFRKHVGCFPRVDSTAWDREKQWRNNSPKVRIIFIK